MATTNWTVVLAVWHHTFALPKHCKSLLSRLSVDGAAGSSLAATLQEDMEQKAFYDGFSQPRSPFVGCGRGTFCAEVADSSVILQPSGRQTPGRRRISSFDRSLAGPNDGETPSTWTACDHPLEVVAEQVDSPLPKSMALVLPIPRRWWHNRRERRNRHPLCTKEVLHWDALPSMSRTLLSSLPLPVFSQSLSACTPEHQRDETELPNVSTSHSSFRTPWNTTADRRPQLQRSADPKRKHASSAPSKSPAIQCQPHWSMLLLSMLNKNKAYSLRMYTLCLNMHCMQ